jgi:prepilin-type N-terminal cleavage/methylation domain-containing protein
MGVRGVFGPMSGKPLRDAGFTLVELLVVMGLVAVLAGLVTINLVRPQTSSSLTGTVNTLIADLRSQQLKAMAGDSMSATSAQAHGVYVQTSQYTVFKGTVYSGADTENMAVLPDGVTFSTTFPSSQVVFVKGTGEVDGFVNGSNTITITNTTGSAKIITINRYGVPTVN